MCIVSQWLSLLQKVRLCLRSQTILCISQHLEMKQCILTMEFHDRLVEECFSHLPFSTSFILLFLASTILCHCGIQLILLLSFHLILHFSDISFEIPSWIPKASFTIHVFQH